MWIALAWMAPDANAGNIVHLAVAHEWAVAMDDTRPSLGNGISAALGYGIGIKFLKLIPEVGGAYAYGADVWIPRAGARLELDWVLSPGLYAHANSAIGEPFEPINVGFDAGLSLDVAVPYVHIGGFGGIQAFGGPSGAEIPDLNFVGGLSIALALPTGRGDQAD